MEKDSVFSVVEDAAQGNVRVVCDSVPGAPAFSSMPEAIRYIVEELDGYAQSFTEEFADAMSELSPRYRLDEDLKTPVPWACPWLWALPKDWFGGNWLGSARKWARECAADVEVAFSEDEGE